MVSTLPVVRRHTGSDHDVAICCQSTAVSAGNGPRARFRGLEAEFSANAKMAPQCAVRVREIGCKN